MKQNRMRVGLTVLLLIVGTALGQSPWGAVGGDDDQPEVTVTALTDAEVIAPASSFRLAAHFVMADGWHVYGPEPGEAGLPTKVTWQLPDGFTVGPLQWPEQIRFETPLGPGTPPIESFGYEKEVILIQTVTAPTDLETGKNLTFSAQAVWLGCKQSCVPGRAEIQVQVKTGDTLVLDAEKAALLDQWQPDTAATAKTPDQSESQSEADSTGDPKAIGTMTAGAAILFAFLGGLILNLMPCVLPILSVKIMGFIEQAGDDKDAWRHGALFGLGVVVSFWILAGLLFAFRQGAKNLGWGFHLQRPTFVFALALLMFLMALNFFGVFELGTGLTGVGQGLSKQSGLLTSFLSGMLATVIATPCTAPFMGAAMGFALYQPLPIFMAIFTALGVGMALPYVILSSSPALLKFVPKPGAWMESLKQFMGFPLLATVIWLLYVINRQTGSLGAIAVLIGLLFVGMGAWVYGRWGTPVQSRWIRITAYVVTAVLLIIGVAIGKRATAALVQEPGQQAGDTNFAWQPYSAAAVQQAQDSGRPVFVNFTAEWCMTCKVNKLAFTDDIAELAKEKNVVMIQADWTNNNPEITAALESYGRTGVPLYVLYPANATEPVILPQLLTEGRLRAAFNRLEE